jgi:hypothetical protein
MSIAISNAMMAITTRSSINVKPFCLLMAVLLAPKRALSNRHFCLQRDVSRVVSLM